MSAPSMSASMSGRSCALGMRLGADPHDFFCVTHPLAALGNLEKERLRSRLSGRSWMWHIHGCTAVSVLSLSSLTVLVARLYVSVSFVALVGDCARQANQVVSIKLLCNYVCARFNQSDCESI